MCGRPETAQDKSRLERLVKKGLIRELARKGHITQAQFQQLMRRRDCSG